MRKSHVVVAITSALIGAGVGTLITYLSMPATTVRVVQAPAQPSIQQQTIPTEVNETVDETVEESVAESEETVKEQVSQIQPTEAEKQEASNNPNAVNETYDQSMASVNQLALALASDPATPGRLQNIQKLMQGILDNAKNDSVALEGVITQYQNDPTSDMGKRLGSVLSQIRDPEVEQMAQQMALSGDPNSVKAGLEVLGGLQIPSEETLAITNEIIRQTSNDPEIIRSAVHAMPVIPLSDEESSEVIEDLSYLADNHDDEGVRSNSIFKIAEWAKTYEDLEPLIRALSPTRSTDDRISAAMALAQTTVIDTRLKDVFISRMVDDNELWEIRRYSAEGLNRFSLTASEFQLLEQFRGEQVDIQNNG